MTEAPATHPSLLVRLRDRSDEQAWCELTEIYGPVAYQLARRRGLQEADPQDLGMSLGTVYQYKSRVVARIRREIEQVDDSGKPFETRS